MVRERAGRADGDEENGDCEEIQRLDAKELVASGIFPAFAGVRFISSTCGRRMPLD